MNVTVLLDGTDEALAAIPFAVELAAAQGASLAAIHVGHKQLPDDLSHLGVTAAALDGPLLTGTSEAVASRIAAQVQGATVLSSGLGRRCGMPDLPARLLRTGEGPVLWVPEARREASWRIREVLLPHDGSPATSASLRAVVALVRAAGARLRVLHVAAPGLPHEPAFTVPRYVDQPQYEWPAWSHEFLARLAGMVPLEELSVKLELGHGEPDEAILRAADTADLVTIAWHGELQGDRARVVKALTTRSQTPLLLLRVPPASAP